MGCGTVEAVPAEMQPYDFSDSVIRLINGNSNGVAVDLPESDLPERDSHVGTD